MSKYLILSLFALTAFNTTAQKLSYLVRTNISIGSKYEDLPYKDGTMKYSPGGGMGIEIGGLYYFTKTTRIYTTAGYQLNLAHQSENNNGIKVKSQALFNRKFFTIGADQFFTLSSEKEIFIGVGGGLNYSIPGKYKITVNNESFPGFTFKNALGYHGDIKMKFKMNETVFIEPGLRYRHIELDPKNFEGEKVNAKGVELSVSLTKRFN